MGYVLVFKRVLFQVEKQWRRIALDPLLGPMGIESGDQLVTPVEYEAPMEETGADVLAVGLGPAFEHRAKRYAVPARGPGSAGVGEEGRSQVL